MEEEAVLVCYCGQELSIAELDAHMRVHVLQAKLSPAEVAAKNPSSFVDPCTICGKLMQRGSILRHMHNVHPTGAYSSPKLDTTQPSSAVRLRSTTTPTSPTNGDTSAKPARQQQQRRKTLLTSRKKLAAVAELDAVTASESHSEDDEEAFSSDSAVSVMSTPSPEPPIAAAVKKMGRPRKDTAAAPVSKNKKKRQKTAPPEEEEGEEDPCLKTSKYVEFVCSKYVVAVGTCATQPLITRLHRPLVLLSSKPALLPPTTNNKLSILLQPNEPSAPLRAAFDHIFHQVSSWPEIAPNQLALIASRIHTCFYRTVDQLFTDLQLIPSANDGDITAKLRALQLQQQ